ncbi:MAG: radical SAM protein [Gemmataceae bacterium]|nr:radical SAM protein [Gemmataceae bacterium]
MGPAGQTPVIQVHPTRRCNLRCRHCYSLSGPGEATTLPAGLLRDALTAAAAEGFEAVGVSGGEPLVYPDLAAVLGHAKGLGLRTTVTTNGMLLTDRRLAELVPVADLIAVSLDGVPESHDRMRDHPGAFAAMAARLPALRDSGVPFGFIFTLTQHNLNELPWVAEFALGAGAKLLQIHPLEAAGRAAEVLPGAVPDEFEAAVAFLTVDRLREAVGDALVIQLDLLSRDALPEVADRVFAGPAPADPDGVPFARLVAPLIVEPDGAVVPLAHGFARGFGLGNLYEAPLGELMARWRVGGYGRFRALCRRVYDELSEPAELPLVNWYEVVSRRAAEAARPAASLL